MTVTAGVKSDAYPLKVLLLCLAASVQSHQSSYRLECRVDDPLSCSQSKGEVCVFAEGRYRCECPPGVRRLGDGRCLMQNECAKPSTNCCHKDARCIDLSDGYTCECHPGFADISPDKAQSPGRICRRTANECSRKQTYGVDCDPNAACVDTPEGFQCVCRPGFTDVSTSISKLPGRKCLPIQNECADGSADCSRDAHCIDRADGYECKCKQGFVDASPQVDKYPGRVCNQPRPLEYYGIPQRQPSGCANTEECIVNEECRADRSGVRKCQCIAGSVRGTDNICRTFSACEKKNECDRNAQCSNTFDGYKCQCKKGFRDISPDPLRLPGRRCEYLVNECADKSNECDPLGICEDSPSGYICRCKPGTIDVSSRYGLKPGRKCSEGSHACSDRSLHSCDENADCVQLPDGYTCKCFSGYVDVSSNANLPPGRVCTLHTTCPAQPTDLVFLIDGSGSIGSYVFQNEVLRFLTEFTELFEIAPSKTRVSVVQYSDQIRHEFSLGDFADSRQVHGGIRNIQYLTGLTRTGAAIEHVVNEAFSTSRGARPKNERVPRVCIVITDGRSQDNVTIPASNARRQNIQMFAVGVTNHVLDSELEMIAGEKIRTFHVNAFEDLNTRLRSLIQKEACPNNELPQPSTGPCDPSTHNGCDRSLNQVCIVQNGRFSCGCPKGFERHPVTSICGGDLCNPEISSSCPYPEICEKTPFGNYRCSCAEGYRDHITGACKTAPSVSLSTDECDPNRRDGCGRDGLCERTPSGQYICKCNPGFERNPKSDKCMKPGTCDPTIPDACDLRKKEKCLPSEGGVFTCQCEINFRRHPVTDICLMDECSAGTHDCDRNAMCTDTDESFLCECNPGFLDKSLDSTRKPGRICSQQRDECMERTHNCSVNAMCFNLPEGFLCRCKENFVDVSPNPSNFPGTNCEALIDECSAPGANDCHADAICIDTRDSYKCQCKEGFVDRDELRNPGRDCRKLNQMCSVGRNDCSPNAKCIERGANGYECVCSADFIDRSPDASRPGRKCLERICAEPSKHECSAGAICMEEEGAQKYTCKCRDGYIDKSTEGKAGRVCKELINECLDSSLNDCDVIATCKDLPDGYECMCPVDSIDRSPNPSQPGRSCFPLIDECRNPYLNNCSRFADCHDKEEGFSCSCKAEYHDETPSTPGINCKFMQNECLYPNLNDCHKHAECIDTETGYDCKCKHPYLDVQPESPGRLCRFNECASPKTNDCAAEADCIDTDDGFLCQCKIGFYDQSTDSERAGRSCVALQIDDVPEVEKTTINPNLFACGNGYCKKDLGEVCVSGSSCECKPGEGRSSLRERCQPAVKVPLVVRITEKDGDRLFFSSDYGSPKSPEYVEVLDNFVRGVGETLQKTSISPKYITSDINYITSPKVENSTWDDGLLINGTVLVKEAVDVCALFETFSDAISRQGRKLASLQVATDNALLDPCKKDAAKGEPCGTTFCRADLGEQCIAGRVCACPKGQKRKNEEEACRVVESWNLPLYVIRDGSSPINFRAELANPINEEHKLLVNRFESGVGQSYDRTPLRESFVSAEVNDIEEPSHLNASWKDGALFNFTANFVRGSIAEPEAVFTDLVEYIQRKNNFEVGTSSLFISPNQMNPFSSCYKSDCHPAAICMENSNGQYTCTCPSGYRDMNPGKQGRQCLSITGTNECEKPELNECSPDARCIDLDYLYKCECVAPYVDAAEPGQIAGSVCALDYCSDVNFCPVNSTCRNSDAQTYESNSQAQCACNPGYVDVRKSERLVEAGLADAFCLRLQDVDECSLGLNNCSAAAICTDTKLGYSCRCPEGYIDGNEQEPGRICAALLCGLCNGRGDCIHDSVTNNVTCACVEGYTGDFCEVAPSKAGLLLMLLLALLFLLLCLLCCIYACTRCRCFGAGASSAGSQEILEDYVTIPRAQLKSGYRDEMVDNSRLGGYLDGDGASISSGGSLEEIERKVTTDVTTREIRTTTVTDEDGNTHVTQSHVITHGGAAGSNNMETEVDQFAMTSSDHYKHAVAGGASSASHYNSGYDSGEDVGDAQFDRTTRVTQSHVFEPGMDQRTGLERRTNQLVSTTNAQEVNYF